METGEEVAGSKEEHDLSRADERSDVTSKDVTIVDCKETGVHSFTGFFWLKQEQINLWLKKQDTNETVANSCICA